MDFNELDLSVGANEGSFLHLLHPIKKTPMYTENNEKIGITYLGYDSDLSRKQRTKALNEGIKRRKGAAYTAEQIQAKAIRDIAEHALSWQGFKENGVVLEFSKDELVRMLTKYEWMKEQSDAHIGDREAFLAID